MRSTCSECSEDRNKDRNIGTQSIFHASPFPRTRATHHFSSLAFDCFLIIAYSLAQLDFSLAFVGYFIPPRPRRQSTDHTNFCHVIKQTRVNNDAGSVQFPIHLHRNRKRKSTRSINFQYKQQNHGKKRRKNPTKD